MRITASPVRAVIATVSDAQLAAQARGLAQALTYNEEPQGSAKHLLLEMAHRLENRSAPAQD